MKNRKKLSASLVGGIAALGLIAGCGDDPVVSEQTDPQEVLSTAFGSGDQTIDSGVIALTLGVTSTGGADPGSFDASFGGPFQSNGATELPNFDFDVTANVDFPAQQGNYTLGATVADGRGFVNYSGTDYELDAATFDQLASGFTASATAAADAGAGATLADLGLDPSSWLTEVTNEGTEDVEGTETVHISGSADIEAIFADISELAASQPVPVGSLPTPEEVAAIADAVDTADIDIYTGADDGILRKLTVAVDVANPDDPAESFALDLDLTMSGLNEDQAISAPADAQPFTDLIGQLGGLGGLPIPPG